MFAAALESNAQAKKCRLRQLSRLPRRVMRLVSVRLLASGTNFELLSVRRAFPTSEHCANEIFTVGYTRKDDA